MCTTNNNSLFDYPVFLLLYKPRGRTKTVMLMINTLNSNK